MTILDKPGLRILKTAIAVFASLLICHIRSDQAGPINGAIAAIICMQVDLEETIENGKNRILGTILGGLVGLIYLLSFKGRGLSDFQVYLSVSLVIFLLIWLMANLNMPNSITITCIVFLSITLNHGNEIDYPYAVALNRTIDTLIGVLVAVFVNWFDFELRKKIKKRA